jgi:hypothetical protein
MPSTSSLPDSGTYSRWTSLVSVLLPEPERPTIPSTSPDCTIDRHSPQHGSSFRLKQAVVLPTGNRYPASRQWNCAALRDALPHVGGHGKRPRAASMHHIVKMMHEHRIGWAIRRASQPHARRT